TKESPTLVITRVPIAKASGVARPATCAVSETFMAIAMVGPIIEYREANRMEQPKLSWQRVHTSHLSDYGRAAVTRCGCRCRRSSRRGCALCCLPAVNDGADSLNLRDAGLR